MSIAAKLDQAEVLAAPPKRVRAKTISIKRLAKRDLERGRLENPTPEGVVRPESRADCLPGGSNEARPCPFVSCRWHLYLDVNDRTGAIKLNHPDKEPWEIPRTCALDVAEEASQQGGGSLEELSVLVGMARENVRKIEVEGLHRLREIAELAAEVDQEISRPDLNKPELTIGQYVLAAGVARLAASIGRQHTDRPFGEKNSSSSMLPSALLVALRDALRVHGTPEICSLTKASRETLRRAAAGMAIDRRSMRRIERGLAKLSRGSR